MRVQHWALVSIVALTAAPPAVEAVDPGGAYLGERVQISLAILAVRQD